MKFEDKPKKSVMKRIGILVAALALCVVAANAQVQLAVGIKGGPNFASLSTSSTLSKNYSNRTGFHAGAYVMLKFAKIGIQPEIIFSKQGQSFQFNSQNYNSNYDYINVPIMVKLYLAGGLNLQAGPQFGFLASSKGAVIDAVGNVSTGQDLKNLVKSSDVSVGVGLGWDLPFGLNITGRYNIGVSDINKYTGKPLPVQSSSFGSQQAKNQVIQISIGYRLFKIGS